jgi:RNA polymerase sigma-70 factor (ECF subfamily)
MERPIHEKAATDAVALSVDEAEAIRRCQAGDKEAFRFIVERYSNLLFGTAFLMTRNRAEAEELVQDALILAWRGLPGFRQGGSLKSWLVRILVNRVISQKRRHVWPSVSLEGEVAVRELPASVAEDPEEHAELMLEKARVRRALAELPEEARQVVMLRFFAGLSVAEAAAAMGVQEGTVKSRLHRALERLRDVLGTEEEGADSGGTGAGG